MFIPVASQVAKWVETYYIKKLWYSRKFQNYIKLIQVPNLPPRIRIPEMEQKIFKDCRLSVSYNFLFYSIT